MGSEITASGSEARNLGSEISTSAFIKDKTGSEASIFGSETAKSGSETAKSGSETSSGDSIKRKRD